MKSSCKCESGVKCSGMCVCSCRGAGITPARLVWVNSSCCWRSLWCSAASNQRCSRSFLPNSARWLQWRRTVSTLAPKLLSTLLPKCSPEDTTTWVQTTIQLWKQVRFEHFFRGNDLMVLFHCVVRLGSARFRTARHGSVRLGLCFHCSLVPLQSGWDYSRVVIVAPPLLLWLLKTFLISHRSIKLSLDQLLGYQREERLYFLNRQRNSHFW